MDSGPWPAPRRAQCQLPELTHVVQTTLGLSLTGRLETKPVSITLTQDSATRLTDWIDDHASLLTAQRFAKEAFSRFLTAIINGERATIAKRRPGKVISVPLAELLAEGEVIFKDVALQGRQLT